MAVKKPLVLSSTGEIEEVQTGDEVTDPSPDKVTYTADEDLAQFDVVYMSAADNVSKAKADSASTLPAIGITLAAANDTNPVEVQVKGLMTDLTGLTAKSVYFVSEATAGAKTATAPSGSGEYIQKIGIAKSTSELLLGFERPIKKA